MAEMNNYSTYASNKNHFLDDTDDVDDSKVASNVIMFTSVDGGHRGVQRPQQHAGYNTNRSYPLTEEQQAYLDSIMYVNSQRDISLALEQQSALQKYYDSQEDEISIRKYLGVGVQWVSLVTENLLSHPFIVLRRQCQVFNASEHYHLHPLYLMPSIIHLHRRQGFSTMWKGVGSCLMVRGMSLAIDDVISRLTSWPKDVSSRTSLKHFYQHIFLKSISIALVMPFYAASLVKTVQSNIASETPGLLDVFRDGCIRLVHWSSPRKGRMLSFWAMIGPSVILGLTKYLFRLGIRAVSTRLMRRRLQDKQESTGPKYKDDSLEQQNIDVYSNVFSIITTEMIFYPFETIMHRIQLQGTRTIVDNLDNGYAVVPILTNYQGAVDCYRSTLVAEGFAGLYKGFGALILQFAAHIAIIKLTKWVAHQTVEIVSNRPAQTVMQSNNLDHGTASNSTTMSPSRPSQWTPLSGLMNGQSVLAEIFLVLSEL